MSAYGSYRKSQFMVEFNRNIVMPGDLHRYVIPESAVWHMLHPDGAYLDPFTIFGDGTVNESADDSDSVLMANNIVVHELTHLMQGFSLGSEMARDIMEDRICGGLLEMLKKYGQRNCPVTAPVYGKLKKDKLLEPEIYKEIDWYKKIYGTDMTVIFKKDKKQGITISTDGLLETYAVIRSYCFMVGIEPETYDGDYLNKLFFISKADDEYKNAWQLFKRYCSFEERNFDGHKITEKLDIDLKGFLLICDIALHVPPYFSPEYKGKELPECCLPYRRFQRIVETLGKEKGFPKEEPGIDFYITLYDHVSLKNGWPLFKDVNDRWSSFYVYRMGLGFMVSDYYKRLVSEYKARYANDIIFGFPVKLFSGTGIPILARYYTESTSFFEYLKIWGNNLYPVMDNSPVSPMKDPYAIMKLFYNHYSYQKVIECAFRKDNKYIMELDPIFLREIYCRIISKEFFKAVMEEHEFCCPIEELNCKAAKAAGKCMHLKDLTGLPEHCCLRIWLDDMGISPEWISWK